ncbi:MAG: ATP-binding protein [Anaerolineales bacterium]|jgi:two-component system NtrC family sensor kinase
MAITYILLITSNIAVVQTLAEDIFRPAEFQVTVANDILTADKYIQSYSPDLVLLDASVEDGAGLEFGKKILSILPNLPVILVSIDNRINSLEMSNEIGAFDSICNTLDPKNILHMVERALIRRENLENIDNLRQHIDVLEKIFEEVGDGLIVVSDDFRIILVNQPAAESLIVPGDHVVNQPIEQVIHHEDLVALLRDKNIEYPYRCELALDDGRIMNTKLNRIPEVGIVISMQDVTNLKELDRIKSDFVNTVSHDLRSPLTAILGYVDLITRVGPVNPKQDEFIKRVQVSVRNITSLINDLLELGRIESGFDARKDFVSLPVILQYSIDSFGSSIMEKKLKIDLDVGVDVDKIFGDFTRLRQLVDNLLGNAIRYTPIEGQIRISLRSTNNQVIFQVQDTGPGIPPSDQAYIFDKFYRGSNVEKKIPGSGLGLAIVKSIVENHQGRVWVESTLGQGSTFTVVFPTAGGEQ